MNRKTKRRKRGGLLPRLALVGAALFLAAAGYCVYLSGQIDDRFSGRRWSLPSTVYSDSTLLYPGMKVNRQRLQRKLLRLGYRPVDGVPARKGEMRVGSGELAIYLHDFSGPVLSREGFFVRLAFSGDVVRDISLAEKGSRLQLLEVEPEVLMRFFGPERELRRLVSVDDVPRHVRQAVLAAEDARFEEHRGFDPKALLRAVLTNIRRGGLRQGGSTITQQLAKNYFLSPERRLSRKVRELFLAVTMELMYEKDEILEIYLNEIYFGQKGSVAVNGIGEAAAFYFDKEVADLTLPEGAAIAGLIKAPNIYSPYEDQEKSRRRRDEVLAAMRGHGWITPGEFEEAVSTALETKGYRLYGRRAPYFGDYLTRQLEELYPPSALQQLGLGIYTTLDTAVQEAAEEALAAGLARLERESPDLVRGPEKGRLQGAVVVMRPKTGYVIAMAGGRDYGESPFNRATMALRQPGSAFKPFVFAAGLESFTPATRFSNRSRTYDNDGRPWTPRNYRDLPEAEMSLRRALALSANVPTVDLAMQTGLDRVVAAAKGFGFTTPLPSYPSLALGAVEVVPLELARAYSAFAADGLLPWPMSLKDVAADDGEPLERTYLKVERATTAARAFLVTSMLRTAVEEGTGRALTGHGIGFPVAGKTGTTNGFRDAWFVGYTPEILALVWVGFDDGSSVGAGGAGAALPIWAALMKEIPAYTSGRWFRPPAGVVQRMICSESGDRALPRRCPKPRQEYFEEGREPKESCRLHGGFRPMEKIIDGVRNILD